jgi:SecD/SecF fusion protein
MKTKFSLFLLWVGLCMTTAVVGDRTDASVFQMRRAVAAAPDTAPPAGYDRMELLHGNEASGQTHRQILYVDRAILIDQSDVKAAKVVTSKVSGRPEIAITFTEQGRRHFGEVTRQNIGKQLAIIIAGRVYAAPVIRTEIPDGKAIVSGSFTQREAKDLSREINRALRK